MSETLTISELDSILILEDKAIELETTKLLLARLPYKVASASNGLEGLRYLKDNHNTVSLILSDIEMPEMDGLAFLEKLKADPALKAIPVILLSAALEETIKEGFALGAEGYVNKLYASAQLYTEIARVMAKRNKELQ